MGKKENFIIKTDPQQIDGVVIHTEIENKESLENSEAVNELIKFCINTHHPLTFADFGKKFDSSIEIKLNEETSEGLDELTIQDIKKCVKVFKDYIAKPVFTNEFGKHKSDDPEDSTTRHKWKDNELTKLSESAQKYYNSNAIELNNIHYLYMGLETVEMNIHNLEIKGGILILVETFPKEIHEKNENNITIYNISSNEEKIEIVKKTKEIAKQVVSLLEEKN